MRLDILERKEEILSWIAEETTLHEMTVRLKCKHATLRRYLKEMNIEYAGQQSRKGQLKGPNRYKDSSHYTYRGAPPIKSHILRGKLIRDGIKQDACELCGNTFWQGIHLPLELHHKDGDHFNNELANLQILCPNCHAVSAPNAGAATGRYSGSYKPYLSKEELMMKEELRKAKVRERSKRAREKAKQKQMNPEKVDSLGRFYPTILTQEEWLHRKELIFNSNVDLMRYGWKTKVQEVTGLTRRQVDDTIEHFIEEFQDKIYIRS